jgi:enamine deaminase RidA (YjgF/YER057c/UK114 family)
MGIDRIGRNPGGSDGKGVRSSKVVCHNETVYLVVTPDKPYDPAASIGEQTAQMLARVDRRLARAGTDKSKLLHASIYLTDIRYFDGMNEVWDAWIDPENPPCRACTTAGLGKPDLKVEAVMVAAR